MKQTLLSAAAVIAAFALPQTSGAQSPSDSVILARIDSYADSVIRSVPVAGLAISVSRGSRLLLSKGYGVADVRTGRPMTNSTASRIGSITKVFTAILIMKLVDAGQLELDADIRQYLPELTLPPVTVRQALNHTSGLPDYEAAAVDQWLSNRKPINRESVTEFLPLSLPDSQGRCGPTTARASTSSASLSKDSPSPGMRSSSSARYLVPSG